jgi:glycosyltransferase involved in cell wall biosynthesis
MATLLFVGHEASRTGAPFTQLHLINWIKANTNHKVIIALMWGGDLVSEFAKAGEVHVFDHGVVPKTIRERALSKLDRVTQYRRKRIIRRMAALKPTVIFGNSAICLPLAIELKAALSIPLVFNVHELENTFFHISKEKFALDSAHIDFLVPGSQAVKQYFEVFCLTPKDRIKVVYDFIENQLQGDSSAEEIRRLHGIPSGAKLVGAIASLVWRKGADIFIQVAAAILEEEPETYFIWVGGKTDSYQYKELTRDVRILGLSDRILFVGGKSDLRGYYEAFDVFLLTSREDPFPLVCLEAGLAGTPTICFADAGGMPEFVRDDAGAVVPYLHVPQMAAQTLRLLKDPALSRQQGKIAQQRVRANHTILTIGPAMYEIIEEAMLIK